MPIPTVWEHESLDGRESTAAALRQELNLHPVVARLLVLRGLGEPSAAARFLNPTLDHLHDPFLAADLHVGVERVLAAIGRGERVAVHGDYDVDGVASTIMLRRMIEMLGGKVVHFIPERLRDGYGLQIDGIDRLNAMGVTVVVSVDCGIRSQDAAARAKQLGIDLVITDHHEPDTELPQAFAVINPRRSDCSYPDKDLAGAGVAFKFVHGLCLRSERLQWLPGFLKLAALGTLADAVPLRGENRVIARIGLERLTRGPHGVGLQALIDVSGLHGKTIGSYEVGFMLAPRVNAAGRMSTPDLAARLLLAVDKAQAAEATDLAKRLDEENNRRRVEEADITRAASRQVEINPEIDAHNVLVVWGTDWHRGVIGIVASKLVERFCKPAVVLSVEGDVAYGSGRSIPSFNLLRALEGCSDLFDRFGGHRQAAGMSLDVSRLVELRRRLGNLGDDRLSPDDLVPRLGIDAGLDFSTIDESLMEGLTALEPFGPGNQRPIFCAGPVQIVDGPHTVKESHLRMTLKQGRRRFRAMAWRASERKVFFSERRDGLNLAFSLTQNIFRGETFIELNVADVK